MTRGTLPSALIFALLGASARAASGPIKIAPLTPGVAAPAAISAAVSVAHVPAALPAIAAPAAAVPSAAALPVAAAADAPKSGSEADLAARLAAKLNAFYSGASPSFSADGIPAEPGSESGAYIIPNEQNTHLFAPVLRGKGGALISVGTFRSLNAALLGDFSHVIQFDHDSKTTAFNRAHLELIKASRDRYEYLTALLDKKPDAKLLNDARAGRLSDAEFLTKLMALPAPSSRGPPAAEVQRILASLPHDRRAWFLPKIGTLAELAQSILKFRASPDQWTLAYFGTDERFAELQKMIRAGRVIPINGDLAGARSMPALAGKLKASGIAVSAVDLSNAFQYFVEKRSADFIRNLRTLPLAEDASILMTIKTFRSRVRNVDFGERIMVMPPLTSDAWLYFATPARTLLKTAETGALNTQKGLMAFSQALFQNADPRARSRGLIVSR